ncbi:MAG: ATP-dependent DNA helicase [Firmicutes bacterium]|nr:ATP-dependent DNA helicase [Bacillota bacterium]
MEILERIFEQDGLLEQNLSYYEQREGQLLMAQGVYSALQEEENLAVQAGTGLGKTFAYLIPALIWALENKKRVVVSTATLQLQAQLINKDLPFLHDFLKQELKFKFALVKGRNNYICLRKFMAFARAGLQTPLFRDRSDASVWERLSELFYSDQLVEGDLDEIPFRIPESLWSELGSESEICLRGRCPYYNECFFYKARQKQKDADLLITNHALFFADLALRRANDFNEEIESVLADYAAVIFDEAQNTEDYATDYFSHEFSYGKIFYFAISLRNAMRPNGILQWSDENDSAHIEAKLEVLLKKAAEFLIDLAMKFQDRTTRFMEPFTSDETISSELLDLFQVIEGLVSLAETDEQRLTLESYAQRGALILNDLNHCLAVENPEDFAYWLENRGGNELNAVRIKSAPISLSEILGESLFKRLPVIMTSATLASELLFRMGLEKPKFLRFDSPFDYKNQARLYIPLAGPIPSQNEAFDDFTAEQVLELVQYSKGRAFVLFTSYRSMDAVFDQCSEQLEEMGFNLLRQGDYPREETLRRFREGKASVLFAVSSFWEGVDIQGDDLKLVILVKLPFAVPTEPILQARMEDLERQGKNPFYHFTVPMASLRLKQGFGRLIRSKSDRGVIAILDKRIKTKSYGRRFFKDLPVTPVIHELSEVEAFYSLEENQ